MGHAVGKELYRNLGKKIDGLTLRAPWNEAFYGILKELYSEEEADVVVKMPYSLSRFEKIARAIRYEESRLRDILNTLCAKGLVIDFWIDGNYWYMPSPMIVGIFEMTMMRVQPNADYKRCAALFHEYLNDSDSFYSSNASHGERTNVMRTLAHREAISETDFVEVLDYETATSVIEQANRFAIGYCSCRHEKVHVGEKTCSVPLETCSSFGIVADYLVRHAMAREVSKAEMLENVSRSKELKLVLTADNIRKGTTFMCHCCKCCCNVLLGINKHGYPNVLVTSSYIAEIDDAKCTGCELCVKNCPVNAIEMVAVAVTEGERRKKAVVDRSICLGCGVCGLACRKGVAVLAKRAKRVLHPETTFERVILQTLERGTLQNQLLDVPGRVSGKVMRGIIGGFLRLPPVKQAVMSELLRSTFLWSMKAGARLQGKEALTRL